MEEGVKRKTESPTQISEKLDLSQSTGVEKQNPEPNEPLTNPVPKVGAGGTEAGEWN